MKTAKLLSGASTLGYLFSVISASAHPGHSLGEHGATHIVTSPYHLTVLALGGAVLWLAGRLVQRQLPRRLLQSAGIAAVLTAALIWGVRT
jgi:hypothetical protein